MSCYPSCPECKCDTVGVAAPPPNLGDSGESNGAAASADKLTRGARRDKYGPPGENHRRTALLWSAYLAARDYPRALSMEDVCWLNVLQKASRDMHEPDADNLVDSHGYLNNIEEIRRDAA